MCKLTKNGWSFVTVSHLLLLPSHVPKLGSHFRLFVLKPWQKKNTYQQAELPFHKQLKTLLPLYISQYRVISAILLEFPESFRYNFFAALSHNPSKTWLCDSNQDLPKLHSLPTAMMSWREEKMPTHLLSWFWKSFNRWPLFHPSLEIIYNCSYSVWVRESTNKRKMEFGHDTKGNRHGGIEQTW